MNEYVEKDGFVKRSYELQDANIVSIQTKHSHMEIVNTKEFGPAFFLDGELQLTLRDEYIYHEMLVHPSLSSIDRKVNVCILGGGDGCAAREVLKWDNVESIDIYDWDEDVLFFFIREASSWNRNSLENKRVHIYVQDVLEIQEKQYDVILVDLVDPHSKSKESRDLWKALLAKLPSLLKPDGFLTMNTGGVLPWDTHDLEWLLLLLSEPFSKNETHSLQAYKVFVPSFAREWSFLFFYPTYTRLCKKEKEFKFFDRNAFARACQWSLDYSSMIPEKPIKLSGYLPQL